MVIIILLLYSGTESGFEAKEGGYAVGCVRQLQHLALLLNS